MTFSATGSNTVVSARIINKNININERPVCHDLVFFYGLFPGTSYIIIMDVIKPKTEKVDKTWGYELIRVNNKEEDYCSKILYINSGKSTSMHYHLKKHETFYVRTGTLTIITLNPDNAEQQTTKLKEGECMEIPRGMAHQLCALESADVEFDETSTYSADSDSYRVWR